MWRTVLMVLAMSAAPASAAPNGVIFSPAEQRWIREHPMVPYTVDPYWPLEYVENGQHKGLTRDYLEAIARISGLRFKMVDARNWRDALQDMRDDKIFLATMVSAQLIGDDSQQSMLLTVPYLASTTIMVTTSDKPMLFNPKQLNGKTVTVKGGGSYERYLRRHFPGIRLMLIADPEMALDAVASGKAYAAVGSDVVLEPIIQRKYMGTLNLAGAIPDMYAVVSMGVSKRHPELCSIINKSLAQLTADDASRMYDYWVEGLRLGAPSWQAIVRYYSKALVGLVTLLLLLGYWVLRAQRSQRAAEASEAGKSMFLAVMSHEIRTPMNAVLAAIELLQRTPQTPRQQELASLANSAATNLLELLDDVLDVSKMDARGLQLELVPVDLALLAQGVADSNRPRAQSKGLGWSLTLLGLDDAALMLDPLRMRQILSNLLSNAVKFTEQGEVALLLHLDQIEGDRGKLLITVRDTGIGIDKQQQSRLFTAFTQVDSSTTRRYGGSGLGLSICRQLVELMGGSILLDSELGAGTTISVTLPVQLAGTAAPLAKSEPSTDPALPGGKGRVLLVEDQPMNQAVIGQQLRELGYQATVTDSGRDALTLLEQGERFDMILLDCYMPGMDGYETARRIRECETGATSGHTPIIAISAATDPAHQNLCLESGMDGMLSKPLRIHELADVLEMWVGGDDGQAAPEPAPAPLSVRQWRQLFHQSSHDDLASLRQALLQSDPIRARHHLHRLKGAALTIGADELARRTEWLEQLLRQDCLPSPGDGESWLLDYARALDDWLAGQTPSEDA
ncbi:ATP-binding protein [Chromobacterium sp. ATCC 53434]|uniref:ATP-binding protein n=1 Tax=Chromobacterium sp. (strain ATCC 53434 / SC 14030) TaxID=2059672 RepID=UPI0013050C55|nr:ATP-binding protein [Chromobacterium sp. ATCC 53434]